jgi:hypothetical protein
MISDLARAPLRLIFAALAAVAGCTSPSGAIPPLWLGEQGDPLPAILQGGVFSVQVDVNGEPGPEVLVDTGAPFARLNVEAFDGAVPLGKGIVATMSLGGTILWKVPTYGVSVGTSDASSLVHDGGIVGFSVFGQFPMSFNYRDANVVVGEPALPAGLLEPFVFPMSLEGGGPGLLPDGSVTQLAPSRIILTANVEGTPRILLLDTGASTVALRSDVFQAIASDGRLQTQSAVQLVTGGTMTDVLRLANVTLGSAAVSGPLAVAGTGIDDLLVGLTAEVGHQVDGLLGAPFLQHFFVTVDYPKRQLLLHPYTTETHIIDEFHRVGILLRGLLGATMTTYSVLTVFSGTDADRQGVRAGESVRAIDGVSLGNVSPSAADRMLLGAVGSTHTLQFANRTLTLLVEELLPP